MDADSIVRELTRRTWSFGVAVLLLPEETVGCGEFQHGGFFDGETMVVAATGDPLTWIDTLAHEYSHVCQFIEGAPIWKAVDGWDKLSPWLAGNPARGVQPAIDGIRELEADCERRTVRLLRELEAPVDLEQYIRAANVQVHFYNTAAETRKWYAPGKGPYSSPEALAAANPTLDSDYRRTPAKLRKLLLELTK